MSQASDPACPVCGAPAGTSVLLRNGVPVHQNLLYASRDAALGARRGDLDFRLCAGCGFVFNAAFDPALVEYGPDYENSQQYSPAFVVHLDEMVERVLAGGDAGGDETIVEIGCGSGDFLTRLLARSDPGTRAVGIDPSYVGPETAADGRARFVAAKLGPELEIAPDVLVCRHVIEHLHDPMEVLRTVRAAAVPGRTRVFFETPCVEWILDNSVLWDLFYEHCSLFSTQSLAYAMNHAGFEVCEIGHVFGGQYLWVEAVASTDDCTPVRAARVPDASTIAALEQARVAEWTKRLTDLRGRGPVVLWGAGAKGLTFCNLVDPSAELLDAVIDLNPSKQGQFIGGTGHPILGPEAAVGSVAAAVLNPNYVAEIRRLLTTIDPRTDVLDWMEP